MKNSTWIITFLLGIVSCTFTKNDFSGQSNEMSDTIYIGEQRQIFIDGRYLQQKENVRIIVNPPVKTHEKCLVDGLSRPYGNIMEVDGLFRGFDALSKDGTNFRQVERGTEPEPDDIIGYRNGDAMIFKDPSTPPERRYILVTARSVKASEDGSNWETIATDMFPKEAYFPRGMDSQNVIFYDTRLDKYVAYLRVNNPYEAPPEREDYFAGLSKRIMDTTGYYFLRTVGRSVTDDLSDFPMPEVVFEPDEKDPSFGGVIVMDFYIPNVIQYQRAQDAYFLISPRYLHYEPWWVSEDLSNYRHHSVGALNAGTLDIGFAASRDGINWHRYERNPWISLGMEETFDSKRLYLQRGMVTQEDEIWMYYTGYNTLHGDVKKRKDTPVLSRVVLRKDRFTAVEADYEGGEFITPPLIFEGEALSLNLNTSALGILRVEIQDGNGIPIQGYRMEDCDRIHTANTTDRVVEWNGESNLKELAKQPVRLRFELKYGAKLYSFKFGPSENREKK